MFARNDGVGIRAFGGELFPSVSRGVSFGWQLSGSIYLYDSASVQPLVFDIGYPENEHNCCFSGTGSDSCGRFPNVHGADWQTGMTVRKNRRGARKESDGKKSEKTGDRDFGFG